MHLKDELDAAFTRRQWIAQRIGWLGMLAIVVAALLGLFGTSPLAGRIVSHDEGDAHYEVEYSRFSRYQHVDRMHVRVFAPSAQGETLNVSFSPTFVENNLIGSASPEPDGGGAGPAGAVYSFAVSDWSKPIVLAFEYEPRKAFSSPGVVTIEVPGKPAVALNVDAWIHP